MGFGQGALSCSYWVQGIPSLPIAGVALQLPGAGQPGEQAAQSNAGVHGVPRNREQLWICLTIAPLEPMPMLFSHCIGIEQESGII